MSCLSCAEVLDCDPPSDFALYSLNSELFPFVLNCPPGFDCSKPTQYRLVCCNQEIAVNVPPGTSAADALLLFSSLAQQCALKAAACQDPGAPPFDSVPPNKLPDPNGPPIAFYGNAPQSCAAKCPDGAPFTYDLPAGVYWSTTQLMADRQAHLYACILAARHILCMTTLPTQCCKDVPFSKNLSLSGTSGITDWTLVSGSLPPGLTLATGITLIPTTTLSGTPTTVGSYTFTVHATTPSGEFQRTFTMCVVNVLPSPPGSDDTHFPEGTIGTLYNNALAVTACATGPLTYAVTAGTLPPGLTLNASTGIITGTPTAPAGTHVFTITVTTGAV